MEGIDRPEAIITDKDNTSVSLLLTIPPLPEQCNDVVISFPPVIFGINIEDGNRPIPGFPIVSSPVSICCVYGHMIVCVITVHVQHGIQCHWFETVHRL